MLRMIVNRMSLLVAFISLYTAQLWHILIEQKRRKQLTARGDWCCNYALTPAELNRGEGPALETI